MISSKVTAQLVKSGLISERFSSAQRLYQYLNWTTRISAVAGCMAVMEGRNGRRMLLVNTELHDQSGHTLYALSSLNDVVTHRTQKWYRYTLSLLLSLL